MTSSWFALVPCRGVPAMQSIVIAVAEVEFLRQDDGSRPQAVGVSAPLWAALVSMASA
jgi:hypothetical protein